MLSSCLEDCEVLQTVITRSQGRFESERQNVPVVDQEEDTEEGRDSNVFGRIICIVQYTFYF